MDSSIDDQLRAQHIMDNAWAWENNNNNINNNNNKGEFPENA
jgi:hypothetical protein